MQFILRWPVKAKHIKRSQKVRERNGKFTNTTATQKTQRQICKHAKSVYAPAKPKTQQQIPTHNSKLENTIANL